MYTKILQKKSLNAVIWKSHGPQENNLEIYLDFRGCRVDFKFVVMEGNRCKSLVKRISNKILIELHFADKSV